MRGWVLLDNPMIIVGMYQITYAALFEFLLSCHVSCVLWWLGLEAWVFFDFFDGCSVRRGGVLAVLCLLCGV